MALDNQDEEEEEEDKGGPRRVYVTPTPLGMEIGVAVADDLV